MAVCGHQFRSGDESDWVLSTSANLLAGSSTAQQILHELFRKHCRKISNKTKNIQKQEVLNLQTRHPSTPERVKPPKHPRTPARELIVQKMSGVGSLDHFDDSQHVNGCPVKWLYNKRLLDKRKYRVVERWCSKNFEKREEEEERKRKKSSNLRDKTPAEVKIHKINLMEKYTGSADENYQPTFRPPPCEKPEDNYELENRRKKLAAKLNWKLHDESKENSELETSSEISSRSNYLRPRPLLGLKPLLSILLTPEQDRICCSIEEHLKRNSNTEEKTEASLTIQSLDLSLSPAETKLRPKTTNTPRWGAKPPKLQKKLQIPNRITINLRGTPQPAPGTPEDEPKAPHGLPVRKLSGRTKQPKTLSSLFYELKDKTNYRNEGVEYFEEMIRELTMDDGQFNIKRFFSSSGSDFSHKAKRVHEKRNESESAGVQPVGREANLVCGRIRIFEKLPHSNKLKQEKSENRVPTKG